MTETQDKDLGAEAEQRDRWMKLLRAGYMYHQQEAKDTENPIIGAESSDINLFHKALAVAINDAMELIQLGAQLILFLTGWYRTSILSHSQ